MHIVELDRDENLTDGVKDQLFHRYCQQLEDKCTAVKAWIAHFEAIFDRVDHHVGCIWLRYIIHDLELADGQSALNKTSTDSLKRAAARLYKASTL